MRKAGSGPAKHMTAMPMVLAAAADLVMLGRMAWHTVQASGRNLESGLRGGGGPERPGPEGRQPAGGGPADDRSHRPGQGANCDLVVYSELALTTFFPRWYMSDQAEIDAWFEREMPNAATRPLFERRRPTRSPCRSAMPSSPRTAIASTPRSSPTATAGSSASTAPARPCRIRSGALVPASREALFRAGRSRLSGLAHAGRHFGDVHLQRPPLAGDLSGHGAAGWK